MSKTPVRARKKTATAAKATKKPSRARATKATGTAPVERHRLIAQAAYRLAIKHGVGNRNPLRDWLEAEAEVDAQLAAKTKTTKKPAKSAKKPVKKAAKKPSTSTKRPAKKAAKKSSTSAKKASSSTKKAPAKRK